MLSDVEAKSWTLLSVLALLPCSVLQHALSSMQWWQQRCYSVSFISL